MNTEKLTSSAAAIVPALIGDNSGVAAFNKAILDIGNNEGKKTGLELSLVVAIYNMGSFINIDRLLNGTKSTTGKTVSANALQVQFLKDNDRQYTAWHNGKTTVKPATADSAKLSAWSESKAECVARCNAVEKMLKRALPVVQFLHGVSATAVATENKGKTIVYTARNLATDTLEPTDETATTHSILAEVQRVSKAFNDAKARGFKAPAPVAPVVVPAAGATSATGEVKSTQDGAATIAAEIAASTGTARHQLAASTQIDTMLVNALKLKFTKKDDARGNILDLRAFEIWLTTTMKTHLSDVLVFGTVVAQTTVEPKAAAPAKAEPVKSPVKKSGKAA